MTIILKDGTVFNYADLKINGTKDAICEFQKTYNGEKYSRIINAHDIKVCLEDNTKMAATLPERRDYYDISLEKMCEMTGLTKEELTALESGKVDTVKIEDLGIFETISEALELTLTETVNCISEAKRRRELDAPDIDR